MTSLRDFLQSLFAKPKPVAAPARQTPEQLAQQAQRQHEAQAYRQKILASFPFEIVETAGANALAKWQELKTAGRGYPVVIGAQADLDRILESFGPEDYPFRPAPEVLAIADQQTFPTGFLAWREAEHALSRAAYNERFPDRPLSEAETHEPALGDWPPASASPQLSVARNIRTGEPHPKVFIVLVPTDDFTTVPAHLRWGGWNDCPPAEFHVAAWRLWRDRYGAELIGLSGDVANLRVKRRPQDRDEALALAKQQYIYCADIIDQGVESYSALASELMAHDWWYFWWD